MKKTFLAVLLVLAVLFSGCQQGVSDPVPVTVQVETPKEAESPALIKDAKGYAIKTTAGLRYVKNSDWDPVTLDVLAVKTAARGAEITITEGELKAIVDKLNDTETDTQYFLLNDDIPAEEGPTCDIYIVNEAYPTDGTEGWAILEHIVGWPRQDVKDRRAAWAMQAYSMGGLLFIDKVPPKPAPIIDPRTDHEKYHLQMVNKYNQIVVYNGYRYEESCELTYAGFVGSPDGDGPARGWATVDDYFNARVRGYELEIQNLGTQADSPWRVVSGSIHVEP